MYSDHAVINLASVAAPLPLRAHRLASALGHARLVHHADRPRMASVPGHNFLATVAKFFFIPLDPFQESL
jgi:hypothetical protein